MDGLTVSELAGEVGISADTVRYYERIGLLPEPRRSQSGYRLYDGQAVERARFVKRAQRFGLRLADIGGLVEIRDRGMCPCGGTRRLLEARISELDDEMLALSRLRQDIRTMLETPEPVGRGDAGECGPICGTDTVAPPTRLLGNIHNNNTIRKNMSTSQPECACNSSALTSSATAAEPCACGCCEQPEASKEQRIAELRSLRDSIDQELAVLTNA